MTATVDRLALRRINLGQAGQSGPIARYRRFAVGESLLEEFWWGELAAPLVGDAGIIADSGWLWARCWLTDTETVLDRIFDASQVPVGIHVDVTLPIMRATRQWYTTDLYLNIWITPQGQVTLHRESEFEQACDELRLTQGDIETAEAHVRELTRLIAAHRFPPAWVMHYRPSP